jgi:hypothetical protein
MTLPTYYYSGLLEEPLVVLPQTSIVYFESDLNAVYYVHINGMVEQMDQVITQQHGDIDMGRRFDGHWAVIRLHNPTVPRVLAFTVWAGDWMNTLGGVRTVQRLARTRVRRIRAYRRNELAKLSAFAAQVSDVLPSDVVRWILKRYIDDEWTRPRRKALVRRVETDSFARHHAPAF